MEESLYQHLVSRRSVDLTSEELSILADLEEDKGTGREFFLRRYAQEAKTLETARDLMSCKVNALLDGGEMVIGTVVGHSTFGDKIDVRYVDDCGRTGFATLPLDQVEKYYRS